MVKKLVLTTVILLLAATAWTTPPPATIVYQPMAGDGFAAGYPFEAWIYFDRSPDPGVPGYAFPEGTIFRFKFPQAFMPRADRPPQAVLLGGNPDAPILTPFTVSMDPGDPRVIVLTLTAPLLSGSPGNPGLKAIHLGWGPLNPSAAGEYPITIEYVSAGDLSGSTVAIARITPKPLAGVAAWNTRN